MTGSSALTVLVCRPDSSAESTTADARGPAGRRGVTTGYERIVASSREMSGSTVVHVGSRPGKVIDGLLSGRVLVIGNDADLAAVVLRLLRKELLGKVEIGYATAERTPFTELWQLPSGPTSVTIAASGAVDLVPLVRDDVGGVLVGAGELGPLNGTVYVDDKRVLGGPAHQLRVQPDRARGLAVTVQLRRPARFKLFGRGQTTTLGRAVQIGTTPTGVVRDGLAYPRPMDRWTFYKHTEPLRLVH